MFDLYKEDFDGCQNNDVFTIWAPGNRPYDNFPFTVYCASLDNIAKELAENPYADQTEVCNKWGMSLEDMSDSEIAYIENAIKDYI